jgi:hypothetical protein
MMSFFVESILNGLGLFWSRDIIFIFLEEAINWLIILLGMSALSVCISSLFLLYSRGVDPAAG